MDAESFRKSAKEMVDYVADYLENIRDRRPLSNVQPGYLKELIPGEAPEHPEKWEDVFNDIERVIMPGVTHWHSPHFHAYFPTSNSYPGIVADILSDAIGCIGFSWISSPACTELEMVVMDWLGKVLHLPEEFLSTGGKGGGVIQGTASEATLVALLAARSQAVKSLKQTKPEQFPDDASVMSKLVAYFSDQAHSSVERACLLGAVRCHKVKSNDREQMCGNDLKLAIEEDRNSGLIPFFCVATLGTTPSCAFDKLLEIGPVCTQENIWLHIDAAYAGSAFVCPEFRPLLDGVEWPLLLNASMTFGVKLPTKQVLSSSSIKFYGPSFALCKSSQFAQSFNFNPHKWLLVNFDCSAMWFKNNDDVIDAFNVDPLYLKHGHQDKVIDYRHLGIPLGRRFRSLKIWFVLRLYGVTGLQNHIRKQVALAKEFETLVRGDDRFQVTNEVVLGLVCFRLKATNETNKELLRVINADGRIHMVPSESKGIYFIRFAVCASRTESSDIQFAWDVIKELAEQFIN